MHIQFPTPVKCKEKVALRTTISDMDVLRTQSQLTNHLSMKLTKKIRKDISSTKRYGFYIDVEEHKLGDHGEPPNYRAALLDLESEKWLEAMNVEMQSIKDNQVWNLVNLPPNCKTVRSKWLFKKKSDIDGNIPT
ncbi:hypothetical protein Tco_0070424, partial [Tanacetum coccineum]